MAKESQSELRLQASPGRAADALFDVFAGQIAAGVLKDGDTLSPEREIVETYGVSRTVAREAVQALANRGLVEARPRFRPVVRRPGYDAAIQAVGSIAARLLSEQGGVRNLFDLRIMMEVALARETAISANRDHIQRLKRALAANEDAIDDSNLFFQTDIAFHSVLCESPGEPDCPLRASKKPSNVPSSPW